MNSSVKTHEFINELEINLECRNFQIPSKNILNKLKKKKWINLSQPLPSCIEEKKKGLLKTLDGHDNVLIIQAFIL